MPRHDGSAVRNRIEKCLAPVPRHVKAHCEPKIPGAPQGETEKEADRGGRQVPGQRFMRGSQVHSSRREAEHAGRRPESNRLCERELRVTAQQELLKESHQKEEHRPEQCELKHTRAMKCDGSEIESSRAAQSDH